MKFLTQIPDAYRRSLAWLVLSVWLLSSGVAIWLVFHEPYRDFLQDRVPVVTSGVSASDDSRITVVHFLDDKCSCTRFSRPHIEALESTHIEARHVFVEPGNSKGMFAGEFSDLVVTSPSVAVMNKAGSLAYYGPYTDGLVCSQGNDLVKRVFENLAQDSNYQWMNVLGYGCFCDWPVV